MGLLKDGCNSLYRRYKNIFFDFRRQMAIDMLLGVYSFNFNMGDFVYELSNTIDINEKIDGIISFLEVSLEENEAILGVWPIKCTMNGIEKNRILTITNLALYRITNSRDSNTPIKYKKKY